MRIGPHTRPDYGIVVGRSKPCTVAQPEAGITSFSAGRSNARSDAAARCDSACCGAARRSRDRSPTSTSAASRACRRSAAFARAANGRRRSRSRPASRCTVSARSSARSTSAASSIHSQVEDALGVNTGLSYKNTPFAWSPGTGRGAWGMFVHTPGRVAHGVGHPDWSHRSYAIVVDDEALDLFLFAAETPADILDLYTQLTGRAPEVPRWSLGLWVSRAYYKTPDEAIAVAAKLRERRIPCDVITLDGRAAWNVRTRFDFEWDPDARSPILAHRLRSCASITCASASGSIRTSRSTAAVPGAASRRTCCSRTTTATPTCSHGTRRRARPRSATC